jgi:hypothetical protein
MIESFIPLITDENFEYLKEAPEIIEKLELDVKGNL